MACDILGRMVGCVDTALDVAPIDGAGDIGGDLASAFGCMASPATPERIDVSTIADSCYFDHGSAIVCYLVEDSTGAKAI